MQDVAPGRIIGGRYTLNERRLASADGVEAWSAGDAARQAEVTLTLFPATAPTSPAILDAARRAAHVQDDRLVRILDVGTSGHLSWIVEEHHPGARTLVDVVEDQPLTGEETRTVVGEAATALAAAARRGMHHQRLTPYAVLLTRSGEVKVSGLGTVLALEGGEEPPTGQAELVDVHGLLAVAYYALTTRWPLPAEVPGILPAPRVVGGVPAPSEIAAGVPADLDLLCRTAFNGHGGPSGPAALAEEIAPWRQQIRARDHDSAAGGAAAAGSAEDSPDSSVAPHVPDAADLPVLTAPTMPPVTDDTDIAESTAIADGAESTAIADGAESTAVADGAESHAEPAIAEPALAGVSSGATVPAAARPSTTTAAPVRSVSAAPHAVDADPPPGDPAGHPANLPVSQPAGQPAAATEPDDVRPERGEAAAKAATAAGAAAASAAAVASEVVGKLGTFARAAADKAHLAREEARARAAEDRAEREYAERHAVRLADIPEETGRETPGPLMRMLDPDEKPGTHARVVLASVAAVVALALLISSIVVIRGFRSGGGSVASAVTGAATSGATPNSSTAPNSPNLGSANSGPLVPLAIVDGSSIDPVGNDGENDAQIPRAYDGSDATKWQSETYRSDPRWDGSATNGVGLAFKLEQPATLRQVKLTFPSSPGQSGTVYVAPTPDLSGATKVGDFADATGQVTVDVTGATPAPYVIVWFTKAPRDGGGYRASLVEIVPMG